MLHKRTQRLFIALSAAILLTTGTTSATTQATSWSWADYWLNLKSNAAIAPLTTLKETAYDVATNKYFLPVCIGAAAAIACYSKWGSASKKAVSESSEPNIIIKKTGSLASTTPATISQENGNKSSNLTNPIKEEQNNSTHEYYKATYVPFTPSLIGSASSSDIEPTGAIEEIHTSSESSEQAPRNINDSINEQGDTQLIYAARIGNYNDTKSALDAGADPNIKNNNGTTALMANAAITRNADIIKLLLNAHADANLQNNAGQTALMLAVQNPASFPADSNNDPVIEALVVDGNTDLWLRDNTGDSVIDYLPPVIVTPRMQARKNYILNAARKGPYQFQ